MCILNSKQMRCPSRHLCNRDGNWEKMYSFQAIFISYETLSKSPTPPQFNTLGIRHFECSVAQILISLVVVFKCPNPVDTHGKNKLWKRTRIALEYLLSLTWCQTPHPNITTDVKFVLPGMHQLPVIKHLGYAHRNVCLYLIGN